MNKDILINKRVFNTEVLKVGTPVQLTTYTDFYSVKGIEEEKDTIRTGIITESTFSCITINVSIPVIGPKGKEAVAFKRVTVSIQDYDKNKYEIELLTTAS